MTAAVAVDRRVAASLRVAVRQVATCGVPPHRINLVEENPVVDDQAVGSRVAIAAQAAVVDLVIAAVVNADRRGNPSRFGWSARNLPSQSRKK